MLHSSSEDDDDGTFKSVSILQYENSLQQVTLFFCEVRYLSGRFIMAKCMNGAKNHRLFLLHVQHVL